MALPILAATAPATLWAVTAEWTYRVTVASGFGTNFNDCFRFDTPNVGDLSIDLLGQTITFRRGQLDTVDQRFKAVSRSGQALAIMYYGEAYNALNQLVGEAVNEFGDTFVFSGPVDNACVPSVSLTDTRSPYLNPQSDPSGRQ